MQYSTLQSLKKTLAIRKISLLIKGGVFIAIIIFIGLKLYDNAAKVNGLLAILQNINGRTAFAFLLLLLVLSWSNWMLEVLKWKLLVSKIAHISMGKSLRGVLTGLTLGFITPHALGDYAGRIWQLPGANRMKSMGAIMLGRAAQYFATFIFGLVGVGYLINSMWYIPYFYFGYSVFIFLLFSLGLSLFLFGRNYFLRILSIKILLKIKPWFLIITKYSRIEILQILSLAFARYVIFASQYFLLLYFFTISENNMLLIAAVTWILLAKSSIPTFNFLSDLGTREFSALFFFSYFQVNEMLVLTASFMLWCINILMPALLGLVGVYSMKIFQKQ